MNLIVRKILPDIQIYIALALMIGFSVFAIHTANNSAQKAKAAAAVAHREAEKAQAAADKKLCAISVPSWDVRYQLILDTNIHSELASNIDPTSDIGKTLQAQIDHVNQQRDDRKKRDLILNGERPCQ